MAMSVRSIQETLVSLGYSVGPSGVDGKSGKNTQAAVRAFQKDQGLTVNGIVGPETEDSLLLAESKKSEAPTLSPDQTIPMSWMPRADIDRVIVHWTAGQHRASSDDRTHYHVLTEFDGQYVRGIPTIDKNDASGARAGYAAHTLNCNTGSIGVSMCGMVGAVESPFSPGHAPLTQTQWDANVRLVATLCQRYGIPVTDRTVLTHAEVQPNLGIRQRGKWDITRLPFNSRIVGHRAVGDLLRQQVAAAI